MQNKYVDSCTPCVYDLHHLLSRHCFLFPLPLVPQTDLQGRRKLISHLSRLHVDGGADCGLWTTGLQDVNETRVHVLCANQEINCVTFVFLFYLFLLMF